MHKKLLTLAVAGALAAPAAALAQVEVYGTIHMSINKMKYDEATGRHPGFGIEIGRGVACLQRRRAGAGEPRRRPERMGASRDQRVDGALEQRRAHVQLRIAQLRGRPAGRLG